MKHRGRLFNGEPRAYARNTDPVTSHEAADQVQPSLNELQENVLLAMVDLGPATDEDLTEYCAKLLGERGESTYRSRRSWLTRHRLVKNSGRKKIQDGTKRILWELTALGKAYVGE